MTSALRPSRITRAVSSELCESDPARRLLARHPAPPQPRPAPPAPAPAPSPEEVARRALDAAGLDADSPYPGTARAAWRVRCRRCQRQHVASLLQVLREGTALCDHTDRPGRAYGHATRTQASDELWAAGLAPLEPYPGRTGDHWRVKCQSCGTELTTTLEALRGRHGTGHAGPCIPPATGGTA